MARNDIFPSMMLFIPLGILFVVISIFDAFVGDKQID